MCLCPPASHNAPGREVSRHPTMPRERPPASHDALGQVERIKERVEEKEGIPPQQQRLIYSGKQM